MKFTLSKISFFKTLVLAAIFGYTLPLFSQEFQTLNGRKFRHYTIKDGLPENSVTSIMQDRFGFMWFGTESSLVRYDGYEFKKFAPELEQKDSSISFHIKTLFEDKDGFIWIGTQKSGLYRFSRKNESFKYYFYNPDDSNSLSNNKVKTINQSADGAIWVGTKKGLNRLMPADKEGNEMTVMSRYFQPDTSKVDIRTLNEQPRPADFISGNNVSDIFKDSKGVLWLGTQGGLSKVVLGEKGEVQFQNYFHVRDNPQGMSIHHVSAILERTDGKLWVFGKGNVWLQNELNLFNPATWKVERRYKDFFRGNGINSVVETMPGKFWIGCTGTGFYEIDFHPDTTPPHKKTINYLPDQKAGVGRLPNQQRNRWHGGTVNSANAVFQDSYGNLWIGTSNSGLWQYSKAGLFQFINFPRTASNENTSSTCVLEDKSGQIWVGTDGEGLYNYNREKRIFKNYKFDVNHPQQLYGNHIHSLFEDSRAVIWIGNNRGLNHFDTRSGQFNQQLYKLPSIGLTNVYYVNDLYEDEKEVFWLGYMNGGIVRYRPDKHAIKFYKHNPDDSTAIFSNRITKIYSDRSGTLWVGFRNRGFDKINFIKKRTATSYKSIIEEFNITDYLEDEDGDLLVKLNQNIDGAFWIDGHKYVGKEKYLKTVPEWELLKLSFKNYLPDISVLDLYEDEKGRFWIGTNKNGLLLFDHKNGKTRMFTTADGLPDNNVTSILPDTHSNLWIVTASGITKFNPDNFKMTTFDVTDGLQMPYKDKRTNFINKNGEFLICGLNGFYIFHPDSIPDNLHPPNVVLTKFKLHNELVEWRENTPLKQPIYLCKQLNLLHHQNTFTFEFAALHYENSNRNHFQCILEGVENDWRILGNKREAAYTDLRPGNYIFKVKASNRDGVWSEEIVSLSITIFPPWWATWWAYLMYAIFTFSIIYAIYRFQLKRKLAVAEAERLRELDSLKNRLYTYITHEFRTPLTVISGMVESFQDSNKPKHQKAVELIRRNSENLLNLINQMLDLSKLESGKLQLDLVQADVVPFLQYVAESFQSYAAMKNIRLMSYTEAEELVMDFDEKKLQHIVANLLSNAVKFTSEFGKIVLHLAEVSDEGLTTDKCLQIKIKDNGIGIPEDKLPFIFDRYYMVDKPSMQKGEGTGIGLAMVQELVKLMAGKIEVSSIVGKGTEFVVLLPVRRISKQRSSPASALEGKLDSVATLPSSDNDSESVNSPINDGSAEKPLLLVVEDNPDVVIYIETCLEEKYQIQVAKNGQEGIDKALETIPDIIICDVMMPVKDGYEVCDELKKDERTSHIPIIILTAKMEAEDKITGLRQGADVYLTKPFNKQELLIRLEKLIELREVLQARYGLFQHEKNNDGNNDSKEDAFLSKVHALVLENLSDESFGIPQLCRGMGMSRSQIYRKLIALTGKSTSHYINSIRLYKAQELLKSGNLNVSEVAFDVGFSDPAYFSRLFTKEFGYPPSEIKD